jgi:hypothetical protein
MYRVLEGCEEGSAVGLNDINSTTRRKHLENPKKVLLLRRVEWGAVRVTGSGITQTLK